MKHTLLLSLGFALACCTPMQMDMMEQIEYHVTDAETADHSSLKKFDPMLESYGNLFFFLDKKLTFRVAAISYPTVDPNGKPITASGLVYHPVNRKSKGVFDVLPTAHVDSDGGASEQLYAAEGLLALLGYTVILPDLIGSGASKDKQVPFLMTQNTGRVAYDMRRAAARYLQDQFGYRLPAETVIMGYSLGGSAALATQKYYETRHANTVKVKEVYAGGGAYDLPAAFAEFARTGIATYPAIPQTILAFNHYYDTLRLNLANIFKEPLLSNYSVWFDGRYTSTEVMKRLGSELRHYMHEDFFLPLDQQNIDLQKLHPLLKENSVTEGWTPKAPIYLSHAKADTHVPAVCAEEAVRKLRKAGANISFFSYPGDHYTVGYLYFFRSVLHFLTR